MQLEMWLVMDLITFRIYHSYADSACGISCDIFNEYNRQDVHVKTFIFISISLNKTIISRPIEEAIKVQIQYMGTINV